MPNLTGKTIGQLTELTGITQDTLFPIELSGNTFHVPYSGFNVIDLTYNELKNRIDNNELIPGQWYKIIDFQTKYKVISKTYYNNVYLPSLEPNLQEGPIEPLIVRASNQNELQSVTYSETYPQDIIYYNIEDPFNEFGRPLTYNLNFENLPSGYYTDSVEYFEVIDPYDSTNFSQIVITFDNVGDIIDVKFNNPYYKENYQYKISNSEGVYGFVTPLTIEKFGGDKGYISRRVDTVNDISVQGDWRVIKYRRWAFEKLSGTTISGVFYTGEIVTGSVSGTKGYLDYYQGDGVNGSFGIKRNNASNFFGGTFGGQFQVGEIITGEKSGAEATIISIDIDDIYEGINPIPSNPGEISSENGLVFYSFINPTSFPIAGYSGQTLIFLQDSTTGVGSGLEVEIEFDSLGYMQNYVVINGGQNYKNNDLITTNDLGSGSINLKVDNTKYSELIPGVKCYVQSGTALYNGVEYNVGETFIPISTIWNSFNPLEYFQQVGSTPVVVKKLWNGVCFDNGLPYDDFTIFNEELLKLGYDVNNVNFTWDGEGNNDYWKFEGKEYFRSLTYLGTVVIRNCQNINVGALIDCSATSLRGLKSLDPVQLGRVFESVFANGDAGGGNIQFNGELCCNVLCHSFNGGKLNVDKLTGLITTNQVSISNVEIGFSYLVTFGSRQDLYSVISNSKFITELNNWFSTSSINNNYISGYRLFNWNIYSEFTGNQIVISPQNETPNITINNLFSNNSIFISELMKNLTFNDYFTNNTLNINNFVFNIFNNEFQYNTITSKNFVNTIAEGEFKYNLIDSDGFITNNIYDSFNYNQIKTNFFRENNFSGSVTNNIISSDNFQYNLFYSGLTKNKFIGDAFESNVINDDFKFNDIQTDVTGTTFNPGTHVYSDYNCIIFKNSDLNNRLSYYSGDTLTVTDIDL